MGRTEVFELRPRSGFAASAMARRIPPEETVLDVVLTAAYSVLGRWREEYEDIDERRAQRVLGEWRPDHLAARTVGNPSGGDQTPRQTLRGVMKHTTPLHPVNPHATLTPAPR